MIVGIDPSSHSIAVSCISASSGFVFVGKQKIERKGRWEPEHAWAVETAADQIFTDILIGRDDRIYLESPVVGRGGANATIVQSYVSGIIQSVAAAYGVDLRLVHHSKWKAQAVGNGNSSKENTAMVLAELHPELVDKCGHDSDLWDACGLALYGASAERDSE